MSVEILNKPIQDMTEEEIAFLTARRQGTTEEVMDHLKVMRTTVQTTYQNERANDVLDALDELINAGKRAKDASNDERVQWLAFARLLELMCDRAKEKFQEDYPEKDPEQELTIHIATSLQYALNLPLVFADEDHQPTVETKHGNEVNAAEYSWEYLFTEQPTMMYEVLDREEAAAAMNRPLH